MTEKVVALILAGGRGSRMDILCQDRPKPVLPFAGRFRVIDFTLSNCVHSGMRDIGVLVDYQWQHLAEYLNDWQSANDGAGLVTVLEPRNGSYKGTADAVYQNLDYLGQHNPDTVVLLAGDHVYRMDYEKMLAFHRKMDADLTVAVNRVPMEQAPRFGIVTADSYGRVQGFVEKPQAPSSNLASMGIYVFKRQAFVDYLIADSAKTSSPHDCGYGCVPQMVRENKVFTYNFEEYWRDIGTVQSYYDANMEWLVRTASPLSDERWPILAASAGLQPAMKSHSGTVRNSLVSPGCVVKGSVDNSVLSPGVTVEENSVVRNSIVLADTVIGRHSHLEQCIVDEKATIGEFCYLGFGNANGPTTSKSGITLIGRGAFVPAGTAIGRGSRVLPDVKRADFTASVLRSGSVLSHGRD